MLVALAKPLGLGNTISAGHPPSRNLFLTGHASGPCKASWAWKHWAFVQMKLGTDHILALVWM